MRNKGHQGPHARVLRWTESWRDIEEQERKMRALQDALEAKKREEKRIEAERNRRMAMMAQAAEKAQAKIAKSMQDKIEKDMQRVWEGVPRNFRDHTVGKIRGPKR